VAAARLGRPKAGEERGAGRRRLGQGREPAKIFFFSLFFSFYSIFQLVKHIFLIIAKTNSNKRSMQQHECKDMFLLLILDFNLIIKKNIPCSQKERINKSI
jgi:hypothetical protein